MGIDGTPDRIKGDMTMMDVFVVLADGNPGAVRVLLETTKASEKVDPDGMMGAFGAMLMFDTYRFYGSKIWMLYKDLCGQSIAKTLGMIRAMQLGYVDYKKVHTAIGDDLNFGKPEVLDEYGGVDGLLAKVKEYLPRFDLDFKLG